MKKSHKVFCLVLVFCLLLSSCLREESSNTENKLAQQTDDKANQTDATNQQKEDDPQQGNDPLLENTPSSKGEDNRMIHTATEVVEQMTIGWNLGNTFDATNSSLPKDAEPLKWETGWGNPVTTPELIQTILDKGFNVIRIPVTWNDHLIGQDYQIEESWMDRVQEVVDYAYDQGAYVILNTHHESWNHPYYANKEKGSTILRAIWTQIANRFCDYDEHLIFEGMNEPRKIGTPVEWTGGDEEGWEMVNEFNRIFIETVRAAGGNNPQRILMIPAYGANCWVGMEHLEVPREDDRIIVSVHAYEPYEFALNVSGRGNWNEDTVNIDQIMAKLKTLFIDKGIPVVLGEFGAMTKSAEGNTKDRAAWAKYYVSAAGNIGVPCVWWDNGAFEGSGELFGIINRETCEWQYPEIVEALLEGAGA
ncbi:MAG: glycoside hydrolase family 5 protein [Clostridium sp.]|jgi:endoglucanase|nr:glycoside hydrolase family 5 protein [Clostridium sp.]